MSDPLLSVGDLRARFDCPDGTIRAVDDVSFEVDRGETVGLVGESGCGKSTVATTLMGLEEPTAGDVRFDCDPVDGEGREAVGAFRRRTGMMSQDSTSSFEPWMAVGESVAEPLAINGPDDRSRRRGIVADLLERVGLSAQDAKRYPHALSGG